MELYDVSKVDFDRLRREFSGSSYKNTSVQSLKAVIEARLAHLVGQNLRRLDLQRRYEEIVKNYNAEKDRATIEATFDHLAFHAESWEQVDHIAEWVEARGYTVLYKERHPYAGGPNYYALLCEDPDRIKVEVVAPDGA